MRVEIKPIYWDGIYYSFKNKFINSFDKNEIITPFYYVDNNKDCYIFIAFDVFDNDTQEIFSNFYNIKELELSNDKNFPKDKTVKYIFNSNIKFNTNQSTNINIFEHNFEPSELGQTISINGSGTYDFLKINRWIFSGKDGLKKVYIRTILNVNNQLIKYPANDSIFDAIYWQLYSPYAPTQPVPINAVDVNNKTFVKNKVEWEFYPSPSETGEENQNYIYRYLADFIAIELFYTTRNTLINYPLYIYQSATNAQQININFDFYSDSNKINQYINLYVPSSGSPQHINNVNFPVTNFWGIRDAGIACTATEFDLNDNLAIIITLSQSYVNSVDKQINKSGILYRNNNFYNVQLGFNLMLYNVNNNEKIVFELYSPTANNILKLIKKNEIYNVNINNILYNDKIIEFYISNFNEQYKIIKAFLTINNYSIVLIDTLWDYSNSVLTNLQFAFSQFSPQTSNVYDAIVYEIDIIKGQFDLGCDIDKCLPNNYLNNYVPLINVSSSTGNTWFNYLYSNLINNIYIRKYNYNDLELCPGVGNSGFNITLNSNLRICAQSNNIGVTELIFSVPTFSDKFNVSFSCNNTYTPTAGVFYFVVSPQIDIDNPLQIRYNNQINISTLIIEFKKDIVKQQYLIAYYQIYNNKYIKRKINFINLQNININDKIDIHFVNENINDYGLNMFTKLFITINENSAIEFETLYPMDSYYKDLGFYIGIGVQNVIPQTAMYIDLIDFNLSSYPNEKIKKIDTKRYFSKDQIGKITDKQYLGQLLLSRSLYKNENFLENINENIKKYTLAQFIPKLYSYNIEYNKLFELQAILLDTNIKKIDYLVLIRFYKNDPIENIPTTPITEWIHPSNTIYEEGIVTPYTALLQFDLSEYPNLLNSWCLIRHPSNVYICHSKDFQNVFYDFEIENIKLDFNDWINSGNVLTMSPTGTNGLLTIKVEENNSTLNYYGSTYKIFSIQNDDNLIKTIKGYYNIALIQGNFSPENILYWRIEHENNLQTVATSGQITYANISSGNTLNIPFMFNTINNINNYKFIFNIEMLNKLYILDFIVNVPLVIENIKNYDFIITNYNNYLLNNNIKNVGIILSKYSIDYITKEYLLGFNINFISDKVNINMLYKINNYNSNYIIQNEFYFVLYNISGNQKNIIYNEILNYNKNEIILNNIIPTYNTYQFGIKPIEYSLLLSNPIKSNYKIIVNKNNTQWNIHFYPLDYNISYIYYLYKYPYKDTLSNIEFNIESISNIKPYNIIVRNVIRAKIYKFNNYMIMLFTNNNDIKYMCDNLLTNYPEAIPIKIIGIDNYIPDEIDIYQTYYLRKTDFNVSLSGYIYIDKNLQNKINCTLEEPIEIYIYSFPNYDLIDSNKLLNYNKNNTLTVNIPTAAEQIAVCFTTNEYNIIEDIITKISQKVTHVLQPLPVSLTSIVNCPLSIINNNTLEVDFTKLINNIQFISNNTGIYKIFNKNVIDDEIYLIFKIYNQRFQHLQVNTYTPLYFLVTLVYKNVSISINDNKYCISNREIFDKILNSLNTTQLYIPICIDSNIYYINKNDNNSDYAILYKYNSTLKEWTPLILEDNPNIMYNNTYNIFVYPCGHNDHYTSISPTSFKDINNNPTYIRILYKEDVLQFYTLHCNLDFNNNSQYVIFFIVNYDDYNRNELYKGNGINYLSGIDIKTLLTNWQISVTGNNIENYIKYYYNYFIYPFVSGITATDADKPGWYRINFGPTCKTNDYVYINYSTSALKDISSLIIKMYGEGIEKNGIIVSLTNTYTVNFKIITNNDNKLYFAIDNINEKFLNTAYTFINLIGIHIIKYCDINNVDITIKQQAEQNLINMFNVDGENIKYVFFAKTDNKTADNKYTIVKTYKVDSNNNVIEVFIPSYPDNNSDGYKSVSGQMNIVLLNEQKNIMCLESLNYTQKDIVFNMTNNNQYNAIMFTILDSNNISNNAYLDFCFSPSGNYIFKQFTNIYQWSMLPNSNIINNNLNELQITNPKIQLQNNLDYIYYDFIFDKYSNIDLINAFDINFTIELKQYNINKLSTYLIPYYGFYIRINRNANNEAIIKGEPDNNINVINYLKSFKVNNKCYIRFTNISSNEILENVLYYIDVSDNKASSYVIIKHDDDEVLILNSNIILIEAIVFPVPFNLLNFSNARKIDSSQDYLYQLNNIIASPHKHLLKGCCVYFKPFINDNILPMDTSKYQISLTAVSYKYLDIYSNDININNIQYEASDNLFTPLSINSNNYIMVQKSIQNSISEYVRFEYIFPNKERLYNVLYNITAINNEFNNNIIYLVVSNVYTATINNNKLILNTFAYQELIESYDLIQLEYVPIYIQTPTIFGIYLFKPNEVNLFSNKIEINKLYNLIFENIQLTNTQTVYIYSPFFVNEFNCINKHNIEIKQNKFIYNNINNIKYNDYNKTYIAIIAHKYENVNTNFMVILNDIKYYSQSNSYNYVYLPLNNLNNWKYETHFNDTIVFLNNNTIKLNIEKIQSFPKFDCLIYQDYNIKDNIKYKNNYVNYIFNEFNFINVNDCQVYVSLYNRYNANIIAINNIAYLQVENIIIFQEIINNSIINNNHIAIQIIHDNFNYYDVYYINKTEALYSNMVQIKKNINGNYNNINLNYNINNVKINVYPLHEYCKNTTLMQNTNNLLTYISQYIDHVVFAIVFFKNN